MQTYDVNTLWTKLDGTIEVSDSSVQVAFLVLGITPVSVGESIIRIEPDGLIEVSDSPVQVAFDCLGLAAIVVYPSC